jgi:hypothetical protein
MSLIRRECAKRSEDPIMTPDQFAAAIEAVLAMADDAGLSIEAQIEVLEDMTEAMREAIGQRRTSG